MLGAGQVLHLGTNDGEYSLHRQPSSIARRRIDCVLMLALPHHLTLTERVPLP